VKDWLFEHVSDELEKAQEWIMLLGRMTAEQKIAAFLLQVVRRKCKESGVSDPTGEIFIELPVSRTEMADYLGLTIDTVSRQIARLRERRVITVGSARTMVVHHPELLAAAVESALAAERTKEAARV
jgi:CRP/FNR family transcriptional regulator